MSPAKALRQINVTKDKMVIILLRIQSFFKGELYHVYFKIGRKTLEFHYTHFITRVIITRVSIGARHIYHPLFYRPVSFSARMNRTSPFFEKYKNRLTRKQNGASNIKRSRWVTGSPAGAAD